MIKTAAFQGEDFSIVMQSDGWKIGFLRYSERFSAFGQLERHLLSDEAFVLLAGQATLHTESESVNMESCVLYTVPKGVWHHITVSRDATVMVVENRDTAQENTEKKFKTERDSLADK